MTYCYVCGKRCIRMPSWESAVASGRPVWEHSPTYPPVGTWLHYEPNQGHRVIPAISVPLPAHDVKAG